MTTSYLISFISHIYGLRRVTTFRPRLILNHHARRTGRGKRLHGAFDIHRTPISRVPIDHDRQRRHPHRLLDFIAHLRHGNVPRIREAVGAGHHETGEEEDGEAGLLGETRGEPVVGARVGHYLGGVCVGFEEHGAEAGGLGRGEVATDILEAERNIFGFS